MFEEDCPHRYTPHVRLLFAKLKQPRVVTGVCVSQENAPKLQRTFTCEMDSDLL